MSPTLVLLATYIVVTIFLQCVGFLVGTLAGYLDPTLSLMTFLILFMGMFWLAWPLAVRISDWLIPETDGERTVRLARA